MDALLEAVPDLLNPKALLSVLVTVNKWWVHGWAGQGARLWEEAVCL